MHISIITYDNQSILNRNDYLPMNTSTVLTDYRRGEYIESILVFVVVVNVTIDETEVECRIGDLDLMTMNLSIRSSG